MSLFNHEHRYALSDDDQHTMRILAVWDKKGIPHDVEEYQLKHLIDELYKAMDAMNDQRANALSDEVAKASSALWKFYRDEHQCAQKALDLLHRGQFRQAA